MRKRTVRTKHTYEKVDLTEYGAITDHHLPNDLLEDETHLLTMFKGMMEEENAEPDAIEKTCYLISLELMNLRKNGLVKEYDKAICLIRLDLRDSIERQIMADDDAIEDKDKYPWLIEEEERENTQVEEPRSTTYDNDDDDDEYKIMRAIMNGYGDGYGL